MCPTPGPISVDLRRRLQRCYEQGVRLFSQNRHDQAHIQFSETVLHDPGNLLYVEAFLENLQRKYKNKSKGSFLKGIRVKLALKRAATGRKWSQVIRLGPDVLKADPWNISALRAMARACEHYGYHETELCYLQFAVQTEPDNPELLSHLAGSLTRRGQFDQAIDCWQQIEKINQGDRDASAKIKELTLQSSSQKNNGEGSLISQSTESEKNISTDRQELEQKVVADPTNIENFQKLASLYLDEGRFIEAEEMLAKAFTASGGDLAIRNQLEEAQILRARHKIAIAENCLKNDNSAAAAQLVKQTKLELTRLQLEIYQHRAVIYPDDKEIQFQVGIFLKQAENYLEAIKYFSISSQDEELKSLSQLELGECHQYLKQFEKALTYYQSSIESNQQKDSDHYRLALYRAGILAQALHQSDLAVQYLKRLASISPSFKDISARLDKLEEIRDKG